MARCKIGFLINPIAGMGGSVGLKGTDGVLDLAKERGASPVAHIKAEQALENLDTPEATVFLTAAGNMGESVLKSAGITYRVIYEPPLVTSAGDTEKICRLFLDEKVDEICRGKK